MNTELGLAVGLVVALSTAANARADDGVRVEHAAARMIVIPEARSTLSVTVQQGDPRLPRVSVRQDGAGVVVDGGLDRRIQGCRGGLNTPRFFGMTSQTGDTRAVQIEGVGRVAIGQLPLITAHVPLHARIGVGEAVWGQIGPAAALDFANLGCGDWIVADVRGPVSVSLTGSGDVRGGTARSVRARLTGSGELEFGAVGGEADAILAGSGDIRMGVVDGALNAQLTGSGDIQTAAVNGPIQAKLAASGDVTVNGGHSPNVAVNVAGSGDFTFRGVADVLAASIVGSGEVNVAHVTGPISKSVVGSGEVNAGR